MRTMLPDDAARRVAMAVHDRSLLVEAGAGSGKTAVMAGRIVMLLAQGIAPKQIAAVTFTELAASELVIRVRELVTVLLEQPVHPPAEMRAALPDGLDDTQLGFLRAANRAIDEMTCSTIHGFCQRLIKPYPVEADLDPGATLMDGGQGDLTFQEIADAWLREALDTHDGLLAELAMREPDPTIALVDRVLGLLRQHRHATARPGKPLGPMGAGFLQASNAFAAFVRECADAGEPDTVELARCFEQMATSVRGPLAALQDGSDNGQGYAALVSLLFTRAGPTLVTSAGTFRKYQKKTKWRDAARQAGISQADADRHCEAAQGHYALCCVAWDALAAEVACHVLAELVMLLQPVADRFRAYKRAAGLLDFDDLIYAARDLLRDHEPVRLALAARYTHVLVDEFQDTDPLQSEIFWRLCGDPAPDVAADDWARYRIRPGALFLVGDPKQAIYRFRGADVAAFVAARSALAAQHADSVVSISTNFRSQAPILDYVNERFAGLLSEDAGQPGFSALEPFHQSCEGTPCVVALDVSVPAGGKADQQRDAEADTVADLCARLIGSHMLTDRKTGAVRPCRAGDIALLAPTGSDLWRYEESLERRGVPVATQAGKGLYRRQEIQDLIALTRVLADPADTLALGALLRGPLVGLAEEALLDIVDALPRPLAAPTALPRLTLMTEVSDIVDPLARDVLERLQSLRRKANATTPHDLLAQAVDVLRVRPILLQRHGGRAERALANVDLYLNMARAYAVRGLRAFSLAMTAAWTDESRAPEGRPDAQEEAVALYTIHAAKGLEWPIVLPINTMTQARAAEGSLLDRTTHCIHCTVFGVAPSGLEAARKAEQAEVERERIRLWYVAMTRARDLLVLPRLDAQIKDNAWMSLPRLPLHELPALDVSHLPDDPGVPAAQAGNTQTRDAFAEEAERITSAHRGLHWSAPSRGEDIAAPTWVRPTADPVAPSLDEWPSDPGAASVQGGRERGLLIHKLLEEVLNGEVAEDAAALEMRAAALIGMMGLISHDDPLRGVSASEIAGCVVRTLALPEIVAVRPGLVAEYPLLSVTTAPGAEFVTAGVADAIAFDADGMAQVVVDWKSDVNPSMDARSHYREQVGHYLAMTGAPRGLIVFVTTGKVMEVSRIA